MQKFSDDEQVEVFVAGLVLDPATNSPIVILKREEGNVCLPIWIGLAEATSIASALKQVELARPMTHDLTKSIIEELGADIKRVYIRAIEESTFLADLELVHGNKAVTIDARPSDALALAVRFSTPIFVAKSVLNDAKVTLVEVQDKEDGEGGIVPVESGEGEAGSASGERHRNFSNISEEQWEEILEEMDPDDFKYKM